MIHASVELVEAMRGECPVFPFESPNISGPHALAACTGTIANERIAWGYAIGNSEDTWRSVTCPACLALMAEARGAERTAELLVYADQLEGVVAAYRRALVEAPECARPRHLRAEDGLCGAPLELVENNDGFNRRAKPGDRLVCVGCGYGTVGTNAAVAAVRALDALEKSAERARRSIAAIRSAVPVVPGVAEETAA